MSSGAGPTRVVNHKFLRRGTGIIALSLPFIVQWLSEVKNLSSVSLSYWTDSGDIFVGSLVALAFFLAAYNGNGDCRRDFEFWISKWAGFFALLVGWVPTECGASIGDCPEVPKWVDVTTFGHSGTVHNVAAILLFVCLIFLILFFARRAKYKGKIVRYRIYAAISLGMIIGMPVVYFVGKTGLYKPIYWLEVVGLILFGVGWLIAGSYKSEAEEELPQGAEELAKVNVDPKNKNFPTGIEVVKGARYLIKAEGCWKDAFLHCGPTGWGPSWRIWTHWNRIKRQPVFMLCGNVGKSWDDEHLTFPIGDRRTWTAPDQVDTLDDQRLYLFANDWRNKYKNNSGSLRVTIYKLS